MMAVGVFTSLAAFLTGCLAEPYPEIPRNAESGGQTLAELRATLDGIPGLIVEKAEGSEPNVKGNTGFGYTLAVEPDHRVADTMALLDFLVESAWSVRDGYLPNTSIEIRLSVSPEDELDLVPAAEEAGWVPEGVLTSRGPGDDGHTSVSVWTGDSTDFDATNGGLANRDRLGTWPGPAPEVPADMIVPRTTEPE
jgi:hypothetical protein